MNIDLLQKKGVFPYEYIDSFDRLEEKGLPKREQFFDRLHDKECSEEDYSRALKVWKNFQCKDLGDYMFLYLACDVLLLADVFENFRTTSFEFYKLDPAYYISAPQLAWDALLKYSQLHIQLQTDPEIYRMIQPAIRGGICHASVRNAHANNKYMGALYDPESPSSYIFYFDANNLYGLAQSQPLPIGEMKWISSGRIRELEYILGTEGPDAYREGNPETKTYFVLDVDLEYPTGKFVIF